MLASRLPAAAPVHGPKRRDSGLYHRMLGFTLSARLLVLGAAAALAAVAVLWTLAASLAAPSPRELGPPPEDLAPARSVEFESASGSTLRGWHAQGAGRGSVVLAHAVRGNRSGMVRRARFLREAGYSVLLFDAQAHGESPGEQITFGYLEALDSAAAVDFARAQGPGEPVAFLGVSQGGASALLGPASLPVSALVLEAVYPTIREAVENRISMRLGPLAAWLAPLLLLQLEPRLGVSTKDLEPIRGIREISAPLLLIVGEEDLHTTLAESRRLFAAAPEPKTLWVLPGAAHTNFHGFAGADYERRVLDFLAANLTGQGGPSR
jgi:fermentation-respiration switch protein FrsA (DUF1100 family)